MFQSQVIPTLRRLGWVDGAITSIEGAPGEVARLLDLSGSDYLLSAGPHTVAARVEWSNVRPNLTLRYCIKGSPDPFDTQYRKLVRAIEADGFLPSFIVHAYCPDESANELHSLCMAKTRSVIRFVEESHKRNPWELAGWDSPLRGCLLKQARQGGAPNYFIACYWDALAQWEPGCIRTWRAGAAAEAGPEQQLRLFA